LFAKYPVGGHFAPHTDGRAVASFNRRSFFSIILYLNSVPMPEGAGTRFYDTSVLKQLRLDSDAKWTSDQSLVTGSVEAKEGRCLIFEQSLVHEGVPSSPPHYKYIIRSDVMFARVPPVCATESDLRAYSLYREGQLLAEKGQLEEGLVGMKKGVKLASAELLSYIGM
jgi:hypothetical protein